MKTIIMTVFLLAFSINCAAAKEEKKLTLGFMPYLSSAVLLEKYTPLAQYLTDVLGIKVEIIIAKNYAQHMENIGKDKIDISFMGGSTYVETNNNYSAKPLLVRYEFNYKPAFRSVIFVHKDSKLKNLTDLKDKRFAFGSNKSTLSTQVPLFMLTQAGVNLNNLKSYEHLRNHENVIYGVKFKQFDAGSVAEEVFHEMKEDDIKVLQFSPDVSTHVFVTRSTMEKPLQDKIKQALLQLKNLNDKQHVLSSISPGLTGFVSVIDSDYEYHRKMLKVVLPMLK